jgi:ferritin
MEPRTLKKETIKYLTARLHDEYAAHYLYRSAANYCHNVGYEKAAKFFDKEAEDELTHAKILQKYANDWNVYLVMPEIEDTPIFESFIDIIEKAYGIEVALLDSYEEDALDCFEMKDLATFTFLQQFIEIQTESVADYSDKINALKLIDTKNKLDVLYYSNKYFKG